MEGFVPPGDRHRSELTAPCDASHAGPARSALPDGADDLVDRGGDFVLVLFVQPAVSRVVKDSLLTSGHRCGELGVQGGLRVVDRA